MTMSSSLPTPIFVKVTSISQPPFEPSHSRAPSEIVISSAVLQYVSSSVVYIQFEFASALLATSQVIDAPASTTIVTFNKAQFRSSPWGHLYVDQVITTSVRHLTYSVSMRIDTCPVVHTHSHRMDHHHKMMVLPSRISSGNVLKFLCQFSYRRSQTHPIHRMKASASLTIIWQTPN